MAIFLKQLPSYAVLKYLRADANGDPEFDEIGIDNVTSLQAALDAKIGNVVEDTTPQLGGELDAQGNNLIDVGDITFQTGASGGTMRTGTSAADKFVLQGYDPNDQTYRKVLEVDAGNNVRLQLAADFLEIEDFTDESKQVNFDLSGATTSTTTDLVFSQTANRTITFPDSTGTLLSDVALDTDSTFAANSDSLIPSQRAVKTAIDLKQTLVTESGEQVAWTPFPYEISTSYAAIVSSNNQVRVMKFYLPMRLTITYFTYRLNIGSAGGLCAFGLYNAAGTTKVLDTGAQSTTSTGTFRITLPTAVTLDPGFYWAAATADNTTVSAESGVGIGVFEVLNVASIIKNFGYSANPSVSGVLPSSIGTPTSGSSNFVKFGLLG